MYPTENQKSLARKAIDAALCARAYLVLFTAARKQTDELLDQPNDIFFAASICEDIQGALVDSAIHKRDLAMWDFIYAMGEPMGRTIPVNPGNYLQVASAISRTQSNIYVSPIMDALWSKQPC